MSVTVSTDIVCDKPGCGEWVKGTVKMTTDAKIARKMARAAGWHCLKGTDLCPKHNPDRLKNIDMEDPTR